MTATRTPLALYAGLAERIVVALAALVASAAAQAQALDLSGTGIVQATGPVEGNAQPFLATSSGGYSFGGTAGWNLYAPFTFDFGGNGGSGSFIIARDSDYISGALATALGAPGSFALTYTILNGGGVFAGATGGGSTLVTLTGSLGVETYSYSEIGQIAVVPEPESWALLLAGGAMVGHLARRRLRSAG